MKLFNILIINLIFLSLESNIIRDLPFNIYHIEDMSQYESNAIQEGTKYYIRLPKANSKMTLYLTIPKNIEIFPLYSAEFPEMPNENEINKKEFSKEIPLKNKENLEYSIYSFDIDNSDSYKVLYFKNNEALNYLSFYANSLKTGLYTIKDISFDLTYTTENIDRNTIACFRSSIMEGTSKLRIWTRATNIYGKPQIDLITFNSYPSDETLEGYSGGYITLIPDETHSSYGYSDRIYYPEVDTKKDKYFVIRVTNPYTDTITNFQISVSIYSTELKWWEIMLIVIGVIIFIILCLWGALTETGRACCAVLLICCIICRRK